MLRSWRDVEKRRKGGKEGRIRSKEKKEKKRGKKK